MTQLVEADIAPAFTLTDQDGASVSLADYAGRRVIVYFYPADDTPGCTKEACQFSELRPAFEAAGVEVLGISPDDTTSHRAFISRYGLTVRLLTDADHAVMAAYGAWGEKNLYGKKTVGVLRSTFLIGPDGRVERAYRNVRADGHAEKVLANLSS